MRQLGTGGFGVPLTLNENFKITPLLKKAGISPQLGFRVIELWLDSQEFSLFGLICLGSSEVLPLQLPEN